MTPLLTGVPSFLHYPIDIHLNGPMTGHLQRKCQQLNCPMQNITFSRIKFLCLWGFNIQNDHCDHSWHHPSEDFRKKTKKHVSDRLVVYFSFNRLLWPVWVGTSHIIGYHCYLLPIINLRTWPSWNEYPYASSVTLCVNMFCHIRHTYIYWGNHVHAGVPSCTSHA